MSSGYGECACCGEVIVLDDEKIPELCDDCTHAECGVDCNDCQRLSWEDLPNDWTQYRCGLTGRYLKHKFVMAPKNNCRGFEGAIEPCCQRPREDTR